MHTRSANISALAAIPAFMLISSLVWWQLSAPSVLDVETTPVSAQGAPDPTERLVSEFRSAFVSKDIEKLKQLFCWDQVDEFVRETVEGSLQDDLQHELVDVTVVPLGSDDIVEYEQAGKTYRPNLNVDGKLMVTYRIAGESEPAWTTYLIGQRDGVSLVTLAVAVE